MIRWFCLGSLIGWLVGWLVGKQIAWLMGAMYGKAVLQARKQVKMATLHPRPPLTHYRRRPRRCRAWPLPWARRYYHYACFGCAGNPPVIDLTQTVPLPLLGRSSSSSCATCVANGRVHDTRHTKAVRMLKIYLLGACAWVFACYIDHSLFFIFFGGGVNARGK